MNKEIIIKKKDVIPYIYFVCAMAQKGKMYGGLSGKSDYMGGIFDRWINIIPESIIFNKYFLPKISKNLTVISDYYEYKPKEVGIAPDVLGVQKGKEPKPFVEYVNTWKSIAGAPQIEIKSFKNTQNMLTLRNQGYDNNYLVLVETNLDTDYLLPFFEKSITSSRIYKKLKMNDDIFIKSNSENNISSITKVTRKGTNLGTIKLLYVCLAKDFMQYSNHCIAGESPFYIDSISKANKNYSNYYRQPLSSYLTKKDTGLYRWNKNILDENTKHIILDMNIENIENINYIQNSKSSITIETIAPASINKVQLKPGTTYIIKYKLLDRSSKKIDEYFINKSLVDKIPNQEKAMLRDIKKFIK